MKNIANTSAIEQANTNQLAPSQPRKTNTELAVKDASTPRELPNTFSYRLNPPSATRRVSAHEKSCAR